MTEPDTDGGRDWYRRAFSHDYLRIYRHRSRGEASSIVAQLLAHLPVQPHHCCLDLCCGFGRHLLELDRHGIHAVGLDLSPVLLEQAATRPRLRGRLVRGDMRALPFGAVFDWVFSFFTSFGYFHDDNENARVLREIACVLKPGGRFLIDFLNAERVRHDLVAEDRRQFDDFSLTQRRRIDERRRTVEKTLIVTDAAGSRDYRECVKLYTRDDFAAFCRDAGLRLEKTMGAPDGRPFAAAAERLILLGGKP